ncbi:MAG: D-aminoacyl-tRNA deacylase [Patescibacteria group bacterium]
MKILLQKVNQAKVTVNNQTIGQIETGLLLLVGLAKSDDESNFDRAIKKILSLRLWANSEGQMFDQSVQDVNGGVLVVSQFTLLANCRRGLRPDFSAAMESARAKKLYNNFIDRWRSVWPLVQTGGFGDYMHVELINDGPITLWLEF